MLKYFKAFWIVLFGRGRQGFNVLMALYFKLKRKGFLSCAQLLITYIERRYCVEISFNANIHETVSFPHPVGLIIGRGVKIGRNAKIFQNVTLGGARIGDGDMGAFPCIGEGTVIFAGAVVIGGIKVGNNCIIGANAVVTKDVPDGAVCVGVPGKIIERK